ncbi:MAG TPA: cupin domain-containing protein [Balneolales bacterium]|nr:cupin domain-containing protein [Balneolales bacterium]
MRKAKYWINKFQLTPHPEGGYFREVFRSKTELLTSGLPSRYSNNRNAVTSIYFLLKGNDVSKFHRLKSDESWHFYAGSSVSIHIIDKAGIYRTAKLGPDPDKDMYFQYTIEHDHWFGATVDLSDSYALVGCTVAPGFDFEDFEIAERSTLLEEYPEHSVIIDKLT